MYSCISLLLKNLIDINCSLAWFSSFSEMGLIQQTLSPCIASMIKSHLTFSPMTGQTHPRCYRLNCKTSLRLFFNCNRFYSDCRSLWDGQCRLSRQHGECCQLSMEAEIRAHWLILLPSNRKIGLHRFFLIDLENTPRRLLLFSKSMPLTHLQSSAELKSWLSRWLLNLIWAIQPL